MTTLSPYLIENAPEGTPEITEVHYDVWSLRVTLDFEDWDGVVYVDFETPNGFRVLDESDLLEMWEDAGAREHWLFVVEEDGWLSQEQQRAGFTSEPSDYVEYLVAGSNDCVSIMAVDEPTVTIIDAS